MSFFSMRGRRCVLAVGVAAIAATPFAAAPAAHAGDGRTVSTWMSSNVHVAVHDPADTLGRPGDTHELQGYVRDVDGPGTISITSFDCGQHDPARTPQEQGCSPVASGDLAVAEAHAALRGGSIRWRAATDAGPLRLRLAGGTRRQWVHRDRRHAEGTRYESSREVLTGYDGSAVTGTFAGLAVIQPDAWREEALSTGSRTVDRAWRGPAVPLPDLSPVGAGVSGAESHGRASVTWVRPLPDGTALYGHAWADAVSIHSEFGPMASAVVSRQRCGPGEQPLGLGEQPAPGRCDVLTWLANDAMDSGYDFAFDNRRGTASLSGRSSTERSVPRPQEFHDLTASWRGTVPVGVRDVLRVREDPQHGGLLTTTTVSGIRWSRPAAQATWDGQPVQVTEATMYAYRQRTWNTAS